MKKLILATLASLSAACAAEASPVLYHPMNPQISPGAYPSNEGAMNDVAALSRPKNTGSSGGIKPATDDDLLKRAIQSTLASQAASSLLSGTGGRQNFADGTYIISIFDPGTNSYTVTFYDIHGAPTSTINIKN